MVWLAGGLALAQMPRVENAKVESHSFSGSVDAMLRQLGAGPFWVGYSEPEVAGRRGDQCWSNGGGDNGHAADAPVRLEGQTTLVVLARVENGAVEQIRMSSPDCRLDGGGLPFHWISDVPAGASVAWLKGQAAGQHADRAIAPLALHRGDEADRALDELAGAAEKVRERAAFWLGEARGRHGVETLKRMLASDASVRVREQVVFALSVSPEPEGMATLFDAARNDKTPEVRSKALFWIAQKAGNKQAAEAIGAALRSDPDVRVKEQAVFALTQLPHDQGVPMLIDLAKTSPDPAVRKKAMFWLGQSKDARALDFFAAVLK